LNQKANPNYYMQAARPEENPFLTDDANVNNAQDTLLTGDISSRNGRNSAVHSSVVPPCRPPPPRAKIGSNFSSPAHNRNKSAFDDLNNSICDAFNALPSNAIPFSSGAAVAQKDRHQQSVADVFSLTSSTSPQQNAFAQPQKNYPMYSSSVMGDSMFSNPSTTNEGGSQKHN
jgi:hypothetical protein